MGDLGTSFPGILPVFTGSTLPGQNYAKNARKMGEKSAEENLEDDENILRKI